MTEKVSGILSFLMLIPVAIWAGPDEDLLIAADRGRIFDSHGRLLEGVSDRF